MPSSVLTTSLAFKLCGCVDQEAHAPWIELEGTYESSLMEEIDLGCITPPRMAKSVVAKSCGACTSAATAEACDFMKSQWRGEVLGSVRSPLDHV